MTPPATVPAAAAAATSSNWEYQVVKLYSDTCAGDQTALNVLGAQGWDLVAVVVPHPDMWVAYLKRPLTGASK